jgi:ATP-dependent Clp protease ATP-binding subunit ClpA
MAAAQQEAAALGAHEYGSEHILVGLLAADGPLVEQVSSVDSGLSADRVRQAIERSIDDTPSLQRLGLSPVDASPAPTKAPRMPRNRHTSELQVSLNSGTTKWGQLRKTGQLTKERKLDSAVLWLAVLEPTARASKLLRAMGSDPDQLRSAVLGALATPGTPAPQWPTEVRPGLVTRLVHGLFNRRSTSP